MGKLLCDASSAVAETLKPSSVPVIHWPDPSPDPVTAGGFAAVTGLEDQQRLHLEQIYERGVFWRNPEDPSSVGTAFRLAHGGDVDSDGNCLFTAAMKAMGSAKAVEARELRRRTVERFVVDFGSDDGLGRNAVDEAIRHLYSPELRAGWGIHVVQEVKLLARKADRGGLDLAIQELVDLGIQRYISFLLGFFLNFLGFRTKLCGS